jgi:hypothetical protein
MGGAQVAVSRFPARVVAVEDRDPDPPGQA